MDDILDGSWVTWQGRHGKATAKKLGCSGAPTQILVRSPKTGYVVAFDRRTPSLPGLKCHFYVSIEAGVSLELEV